MFVSLARGKRGGQEGDFQRGRDVGGLGVTIVVGGIIVVCVFISFYILRKLNFGCEFVS